MMMPGNASLMRLRQAAARLVCALLSAVFAAAASGCFTLGPDAAPPAVPATDRYTSPGEPTGVTAPTDMDIPGQRIDPGAGSNAKWWKVFQSTELDTLVEQTIAGSHTLQSAEATLVAEREVVTAARSALFPQLALEASAAREKQSAAAFGLPPNALALPPNFNLFQIGATASYSLDFFGRTRRRIEQQQALFELQQYQLGAAYLTLTGNTVLQGIQLAATRAQLQALQSILQIDRQNLELVRKERQVGAVPDIDVIRAENQLAVDETLQPGLDQQLSVAGHALAVLTGHAPGNWSPPQLELAALALPLELPLSLPSELVHRRPDILAAEAQLHVASAQIGIATAQLFPDITLSAGMSTTSLTAGDLFSPAGLVWSVAAGLSQPLFDAGMRRAQRRAALANFKASAADYEETALQAFRQVADILQALSHDGNLLAAQKHALDTAAKSVSLQRVNYERGGAGILDLLDAQRQYQQALLGYTRAEAQRYTDTTELLVAISPGGR
jgi:NodT family efflux transporter outer membrane factor (OMF) lipoprotein